MLLFFFFHLVHERRNVGERGREGAGKSVKVKNPFIHPPLFLLCCIDKKRCFLDEPKPFVLWGTPHTENGVEKKIEDGLCLLSLKHTHLCSDHLLKKVVFDSFFLLLLFFFENLVVLV